VIWGALLDADWPFLFIVWASWSYYKVEWVLASLDCVGWVLFVAWKKSWFADFIYELRGSSFILFGLDSWWNFSTHWTITRSNFHGSHLITWTLALHLLILRWSICPPPHEQIGLLVRLVWRCITWYSDGCRSCTFTHCRIKTGIHILLNVLIRVMSNF